MPDDQTAQDISAALNELRQAMAEASSLAGIIADLQRNTDRLRAPLAAELRTVKAAIARLLPLLEGTPDPSHRPAPSRGRPEQSPGGGPRAAT
jgi:hypothetical protein